MKADKPLQLPEELVSFAAPRSFEADQYRTLRRAVEGLHRDAGFRVLAVTSPGPGDGKTVTALNLAGCLAQVPGARVLVIDADLHRSSIARYLGFSVNSAPGLAEAIASEGRGLAGIIRRFESLNVSVLFSGRPPTAPYELLASRHLDAVLEEARRLYDYVIIDTPPVVPLADCRVLGSVIDGYVVVVAAHRTPRPLLAEALTLLDSGKVVGLVFNGDDRPLAAYYGSYGYRGYQTARAPRFGPTRWWHRLRT